MKEPAVIGSITSPDCLSGTGARRRRSSPPYTRETHPVRASVSGRKSRSEFRQHGPSSQNEYVARIKYDLYLLPKLILIGRQLERRAPLDREQCTFGDGLGLSISGGFDQRWRTTERSVSVQ